MKSWISIAVLLFGAALSHGAPDAAPALLKPNFGWRYTLAVQQGSNNFSFSLMKDGSLAFDTWSDGGAFNEHRIEITEEQFRALDAQFADLFREMAKVNAPEQATGGVSIAFEEVKETVRTLTIGQYRPEISAFIDALARLAEEELPFDPGGE